MWGCAFKYLTLKTKDETISLNHYNILQLVYSVEIANRCTFLKVRVYIFLTFAKAEYLNNRPNEIKDDKFVSFNNKFSS